MTGGSGLFPAIDAHAVPWLSVDQMREVDRITVEELGISLVRMMENAGRSLAQVARDLLGGDAGGRSILVLAGPGGNGGGGLVAARHLAAAGAEVAVAVSEPAERFASVPAEQLAIARRLAIPIQEGIRSLGEPELVLDALLGYSQRGAPYGHAVELIRWSAGRRVLALDVPSGLELATATLHTPHIAAEATMTLAAPKTALAGADAAEAVGRLFLADISVPALVYERLGFAYETPFTRRPVVELNLSGAKTSVAPAKRQFPTTSTE
jgi:NAD(P)H-hydrate epimerase